MGCTVSNEPSGCSDRTITSVSVVPIDQTIPKHVDVPIKGDCAPTAVQESPQVMDSPSSPPRALNQENISTPSVVSLSSRMTAVGSDGLPLPPWVKDSRMDSERKRKAFEPSIGSPLVPSSMVAPSANFLSCTQTPAPNGETTRPQSTLSSGEYIRRSSYPLAIHLRNNLESFEFMESCD